MCMHRTLLKKCQFQKSLEEIVVPGSKDSSCCQDMDAERMAEIGVRKQMLFHLQYSKYKDHAKTLFMRRRLAAAN